MQNACVPRLHVRVLVLHGVDCVVVVLGLTVLFSDHGLVVRLLVRRCLGGLQQDHFDDAVDGDV